MLTRSLLCIIPLAFLIAFLLQACGDQPAPGDSATVTISLGGHRQALAAHTADAADNPFPAEITEVRIQMLDDQRRLLIEGKMAPGGTLSLTAPAGVKLIVTGAAYAGEDKLYDGETTVDPLHAGAKNFVPLTLVPFGVLTTRVVKEVHQIDVSVDDIPGDQGSGIAIFSRDNHRVAFHSQATNLTPDDTNQQIDVFIKNLDTGAVINAHSAGDGTLGDGELTFADMTGDAATVVFASRADNLVADDTNSVGDIFVKNIVSGAISRVSVTPAGNQLADFSAYPSISDDGRWISFYTNASLTDDGAVGVFLLERTAAGGYSPRHVHDGWLPRISGDGNWLIYRGNGTTELWLYDVTTGDNRKLLNYAADTPTHRINVDGQFIVFDTVTDFDPGDTDTQSDVYLYHRDNQTLKLLSTDRDGQALSGVDTGAVSPSLSGDGRYVTFNFGTTIYVKDAVSGELAPLPTPGDKAFISPNGHLIAYNAEDGHLYIAPNPLLVQQPPELTPTPPEEHPVPGVNPIFRLTVAASGDGQGTIADVGDTSFIDCGSVCSQTFSGATVVDLGATPMADSRLTGWIGACAGAGAASTARVTVDGIKSCGATFTLIADPYTLDVALDGDGGGKVTSSDNSIDCGMQCNVGLRAPATLTLTALADELSLFAGWNGDCTGAAPTLTLDISGHHNCTATFLSKNFDLKLTLAGQLQGDQVTIYDNATEGTLQICKNVNGDPQTQCMLSVPRDSKLFLSPAPGGNNNSLSWSGCTSSQGLQGCDVTMDGNKDIIATFGAGSFKLTVTRNPNGTITDKGNQIDCGASCVGSYVNGTSVTLTANPANGYRMGTWGGACKGTATTATVTMTSDQTCSVTFVQQFRLDTTVTGNGTVSSAPGAINCPGAACGDVFDTGTSVQLSATAGADSVFSAWGGDCTGKTTPINVSMTAVKNCTATFALKSYALTVATPTGGIVTSNTGGINCGGTCSATYAHGTNVTLTATPATGYRFSVWGGDCTGKTTPITVSMTAAKNCSASFTQNSYTLTVATPTGGIVTSDTGGINCGKACSTTYADGTNVTLTATPATGYSFTAWSGDCAGTGNSASIVINAAKNCSATFTALTPALTINKVGTGTGTVVSSPAGINCGTTCSSTFSYGTTVTLTAQPNTDSVFSGWSGAACTTVSATGDAVVSLTMATTCSANFTLKPKLTITFPGNGGGTVTSPNFPNLNCLSNCSAFVDNNSQVTLIGTADKQSRLGVPLWSGCKASISTDGVTATVNITGDTTCSVTFVKLATLTLVKTNVNGANGTMVEASQFPTINCDTKCTTVSNTYDAGTNLTITASPDINSFFTGWSGGCTASATDAFLTTITLDANVTCTATFAVPPTPVLKSYTTASSLGFITYTIPIANWNQFPNELFAPSPDLPACGANTSSSRTWVDIYNDVGVYLYGFCTLSSGSDLQKIWFSVSATAKPPAGVYVVLTDRRRNRTFTSNVLPIP